MGQRSCLPFEVLVTDTTNPNQSKIDKNVIDVPSNEIDSRASERASQHVKLRCTNVTTKTTRVALGLLSNSQKKAR